jgi:hypothetical protein
MEKASRRLYGWLVFFAFFGLTLSLILTAFNIDPVSIKDQTLFHQDTAPVRIVGFFSYFTIWSNIVAVVVGFCVWRDRISFKYFENLFATGLIMITITGLIYNTVLLPVFPPKGWYWLTSTLMHLVVPIMYFYLWMVRGPRGVVETKNTLKILTIPIIYLTYTVAHGLVIKQWPYKFLDLTSEGFIIWSIGVVIIFGFGIGLIWLFSKLDRRQAK